MVGKSLDRLLLTIIIVGLLVALYPVIGPLHETKRRPRSLKVLQHINQLFTKRFTNRRRKPGATTQSHCGRRGLPLLLPS
jgi:hypothetical protein